jgi:HD-GYP domain-containing protein (c-di-GMP phosphodiesterase class II)
MNNTNSPDYCSLLPSSSFDERLNNLLGSVVQDVKDYADRLHSQIRQLSDIGRAMSSVTDINVLLEMIVDLARNFTNADAGVLYILENQSLRFEIVQNDSLNLRMGGKTGETIPFPPIELNDINISAFAALNGISVNIPNVYETSLFDFTDPKSFDRLTGYTTKSMLVVLLRNHENDVIGVLQLLNAKDQETGEIRTFSADSEDLIEGLASQAAIAISKISLISDMENLFEAFVKVMATAIDEKSPSTGGHIRRVANLTLTMADAIHQKEEGAFKEVYFNEDSMRELNIAAWMHDIGKVTTPVEIMEKSTKLQTIFDRIHHIDLRMELLLEKVETDCLRKHLELLGKGVSKTERVRLEKKAKVEIDEIKDIRKFIRECNEPRESLPDENIKRLKSIACMTYQDSDGVTKHYITENELKNLIVRKGTITDAERDKIKEHAYVTLRMLQQIPFTKRLKNIPHFAAAHHECIDGSGYPLGLMGDEIPFEGKLMAVADIAEALTADDRPYKKALNLDEVHNILQTMAKNKKLDKDLVQFFIDEKVYETYLDNYEAKTGPAPSERSATQNEEVLVNNVVSSEQEKPLQVIKAILKTHLQKTSAQPLAQNI